MQRVASRLLIGVLLFGAAAAATGFATTAGGPWPVIQAPDTAFRGQEIFVSTTADSPFIHVVIRDDLGVLLFDSDELANEPVEDPPGSGIWTLDFLWTIPIDAVGPLTIEATCPGGKSQHTIELW